MSLLFVETNLVTAEDGARYLKKLERRRIEEDDDDDRERHWHRYTAEEEEYLRTHWKTDSIAVIAHALGRTKSSIVTKARKMKLGSKPKPRNVTKRRDAFSEREEEYIRNAWGVISCARIARNLGRNPAGVRYTAKRLELR